MISKTFIALLYLLVALPFAQLDLKEKAELMGVQVDERQGDKAGVQKTDVSFIFSGRPTQYFHTFRDSVLELQFYDAVLGDEKLPEVAQAPFVSGGVVTQERLNVNKDIEGLSPLFKDVVRVLLPVEKGISWDFTVTDDFNVITLKTIWSRTVKVGSELTQTKTRTKAIIIGSVVGVTAGVIAWVLRPEEGPKTKEGDWVMDPPTLPPVP